MNDRPRDTTTLTTGQIFRLHFRMSRPDQVLLIAVVYGWGALSSLSTGLPFHPVAFVAGLAALLLITASIHFANEYADGETDSLTNPTPFSGGSGALQAYNLHPVVALRAAAIALTAGILLALTGYAIGALSLPALGLLFAGAFGGWMYSLPPLALAWRGWGEITNAFLGAVLLPVYGFTVQFGAPAPMILLASLPFGLFTFANLLATTWPDRMADRVAGKFTLATRLPEYHLRRLYGSSVLGAYLILLLLGGRVIPLPVVWGGVLLLPVAVWAGRLYTRQHSPLPTVVLMVLFLAVMLIGWFIFLSGEAKMI